MFVFQQGHSGDSIANLEINCQFCNIDISPVKYSEYEIAFRNRRAHHEAICFNAEMHLDIKQRKGRTRNNKKYLLFMGYNPVELCWGTGVRPYSLFEKLNKF